MEKPIKLLVSGHGLSVKFSEQTIGMKTNFLHNSQVYDYMYMILLAVCPY